ncbi:hypothetical protein D7193_18855 [Micromonospora costi]|uniref:Uncharacterized protein n=1 Tax=Micromonospora costi TaxID=1530042 RepID=A0A3B0A0U8_9ACTN|nr:hypothetical protein D7193_18855 [Micromonospora costi]
MSPARSSSPSSTRGSTAQPAPKTQNPSNPAPARPRPPPPPRDLAVCARAFGVKAAYRGPKVQDRGAGGSGQAFTRRVGWSDR